MKLIICLWSNLLHRTVNAMTLDTPTIPLFPFPNQLPTAVTTPGHPVDWAKPAIVYDHYEYTIHSS